MERVEINDPKVKPCTKLLEITSSKLFMDRFKVLYSSKVNKHLCDVSDKDGNQFLNTLYHAYSYHYPIVLTPDILYILFLQGLSRCINSDPEKSRHIFVDHAGQITIDETLNNPPTCDEEWEGLFMRFTDKIYKDVKLKLEYEFSTTTNVEKAVAQLSIMDLCKGYFKCVFSFLCGLPKIYIEGTPDDYKKLIEIVKMYGEKCELKWWTDKLCIILEYFVRATNKEMTEDDLAFWKSIFSKKCYGSGSECCTGWIFNFFPYIYDYDASSRRIFVKNPILLSDQSQDFYLETDSFPPSILITPAEYKADDDEKNNVKMSFYSGFVGFVQEPDTYALRPAIGWALGTENGDTEPQLVN